MATQARAAATRQKIIDSAVQLFSDRGFAETGLNDISDHAEISMGAFYYHFASKEAVAAAIIEQGWPKALEVLAACMDAPSPGLENVIAMTFSLSSLMKQDKSVWVANHLNQALGLISEHGRRGFQDRANAFVNRVARSLRAADVREGVTFETVGNMVWMTVHGCHLLSDAMTDDVFARLLESWRIMLPAMVPAESLGYFEQFTIRTAAKFSSPAVDELTARRQASIESSDSTRSTAI